MKSFLLDILVCPSCLPLEKTLSLDAMERDGDEVLSGTLACDLCSTSYPIRNGIAELLPRSAKKAARDSSRYESDALVSAYLWSHYADLLGDENATSAYREWAKRIKPLQGLALDAGCATGRFTFEMGMKSDMAVGIDYSRAFIQTARKLMQEGKTPVSLTQEGLLTEQATLRLPESWDRGKVEFVVGDAQALPFRSGRFSSLASLNLVDKVPSPLSHLREMNRVAKQRTVQFLFSDPFSWSREVAKEENWLGGTSRGPYAGRGVDNVLSLLAGKRGDLAPPWDIGDKGHIWWKIRNHRNHFELIRSWFILARR